jgi:hypothetical protein
MIFVPAHLHLGGIMNAGWYRIAALLIFSLTLSGCISAKTPVTPFREKYDFKAKIGEIKFANVGDNIFVKGTLNKTKGLSMSNGIMSTMPGALFLPFDFYIEKCTLVLRYQDEEHFYYVAPEDKCGASHSMLGSVVVPGDTIGVRLGKRSTSMEWFVDNSYYNRQDALWARQVSEDNGVRLTEVEVPLYDQETKLVKIAYDGFYQGLLRFTYAVLAGQTTREKEFAFDYKAGTGPVELGIKGHVFEVLSVNNKGMRYRWVFIKEDKIVSINK